MLACEDSASIACAREIRGIADHGQAPLGQPAHEFRHQGIPVLSWSRLGDHTHREPLLLAVRHTTSYLGEVRSAGSTTPDRQSPVTCVARPGVMPDVRTK